MMTAMTETSRYSAPVGDAQAADPVERPVFLVGAERSGTTVFRLMLDHHPSIAVCSEFEYVVDPLVGRDDLPPTEAFRERLKKNWIFRNHAFEIDESLDYPALCRSFLRQTNDEKCSGQAKVIIPVVHRHYDELPRLWPNARYIHIVRDPRDVARSAIGMGWAGNVWYGAEKWIEAEQAWDRLRGVVADDAWLEVKNETLICQTQATLERVCAFAGVEFDPSMMKYHENTSYTPPDPSLTQQWKRKLSQDQVSLVEARVGDLLTARGYELSGFPVVLPSSVRQASLAAGNKWRRLLHRRRMLGTGLFLSDILSRLLHLRVWRRKIEPRLYEKWRAKLK